MYLGGVRSFWVENHWIRWPSKTLPSPGFYDQKPISKPLSLKTHMPLSMEKMTPELVSYCLLKIQSHKWTCLDNGHIQQHTTRPPANAEHSGICTLKWDPGVWHDWVGVTREEMPVLPTQVLHNWERRETTCWDSAVHPHSAIKLFLERQEGNPFKSAECVAFFTSGLCFYFPWDLGGVWEL